VADTTPIMKTKQFDWHAHPIPRTTPVTSTYRNMQNTCSGSCSLNVVRASNLIAAS